MKVEIENVIQPGKTYRVDAEKFGAMREAVLKVLPAAAPALTPAEILKEVQPHLPQALFPGGERAGWWMKAVQLDLEAKGVIVREARPPVRLHKA